MIILGIDPGTQRIGYAVLKIKNKKHILKSSGLLKIKKKNKEVLKEIKNEVDKLILKWKPNVLSIEKIYFLKNKKTAIEVAEARGVMLLSALEKNVKIKEYTPKEIKTKITGYGLSDKLAMNKMVRLFLKLNDDKILDDTIDAIALALGAWWDNYLDKN